MMNPSLKWLIILNRLIWKLEHPISSLRTKRTVIFATDSVVADPMLTIWTMGDMLE